MTTGPAEEFQVEPAGPVAGLPADHRLGSYGAEPGAFRGRWPRLWGWGTIAHRYAPAIDPP